MEPTELFETYWRFADERQRIFIRRQAGAPSPWTSDPILSAYRFTNAYRVHDRVSQYLVRRVQYDDASASTKENIFFRTMLFKIFNRIDTWRRLKSALGAIDVDALDWEELAAHLDAMIDRGEKIYSAAYIMPSPSFGHRRKHRNHLALLKRMLEDGLPALIAKSASLGDVYALLVRYPGIGPFLAFQYAVDLNYSELTAHQESEFVVAGPGALDGISKCFRNIGSRRPEDVILEVCDAQEKWFRVFGVDFTPIKGRRLQPIDCQNLFCEISKYSRVSHPHLAGVAARTRIKQSYRPNHEPLTAIFYPPRWNAAPPGVDAIELVSGGGHHDQRALALVS